MHMGSSKPKETHFGKNEIKRRRSAKKVNKIEPKKKDKIYKLTVFYQIILGR